MRSVRNSFYSYGIYDQQKGTDTGDWNAKVASQETLGVTGKFGLGPN